MEVRRGTALNGGPTCGSTKRGNVQRTPSQGCAHSLICTVHGKAASTNTYNWPKLEGKHQSSKSRAWHQCVRTGQLNHHPVPVSWKIKSANIFPGDKHALIERLNAADMRAHSMQRHSNVFMTGGIIKAEEILYHRGLLWQWCCPGCSSVLPLKSKREGWAALGLGTCS